MTRHGEAWGCVPFDACLKLVVHLSKASIGPLTKLHPTTAHSKLMHISTMFSILHISSPNGAYDYSPH